MVNLFQVRVFKNEGDAEAGRLEGSLIVGNTPNPRLLYELATDQVPEGYAKIGILKQLGELGERMVPISLPDAMAALGCTYDAKRDRWFDSKGQQIGG